MRSDRPTEKTDVWRLYQRFAAAFDADRSRGTMEQAWLDRTLDLCQSDAPAVLDLGCGMGEPIAAYLISRGAIVTGVDAADSMLAPAKVRYPGAEWLQADMRCLQLGRRFNAIIAWDSFFHLPHDDQRNMFQVFADHAAPGAPLLFTSGPGYGEAIGELYGEPLYHASLDPDEYRSLLAENGFAEIDFVPNDRTCGGHSVWLARQNA